VLVYEWLIASDMCAALSRTPSASPSRYSQIGTDDRVTSTAVIPWHEQYPFGKTVGSVTKHTISFEHVSKQKSGIDMYINIAS